MDREDARQFNKKPLTFKLCPFVSWTSTNLAVLHDFERVRAVTATRLQLSKAEHWSLTNQWVITLRCKKKQQHVKLHLLFFLIPQGRWLCDTSKRTLSDTSHSSAPRGAWVNTRMTRSICLQHHNGNTILQPLQMKTWSHTGGNNNTWQFRPEQLIKLYYLLFNHHG